MTKGTDHCNQRGTEATRAKFVGRGGRKRSHSTQKALKKGLGAPELILKEKSVRGLHTERKNQQTIEMCGPLSLFEDRTEA